MLLRTSGLEVFLVGRQRIRLAVVCARAFLSNMQLVFCCNHHNHALSEHAVFILKCSRYSDNTLLYELPCPVSQSKPNCKDIFSKSPWISLYTVSVCRMAEWSRARYFNAVTRVQIPLWPLPGVVLSKYLVQLLDHPCK